MNQDLDIFFFSHFKATKCLKKRLRGGNVYGFSVFLNRENDKKVKNPRVQVGETWKSVPTKLLTAIFVVSKKVFKLYNSANVSRSKAILLLFITHSL